MEENLISEFLIKLEEIKIHGVKLELEEELFKSPNISIKVQIIIKITKIKINLVSENNNIANLLIKKKEKENNLNNKKKVNNNNNKVKKGSSNNNKKENHIIKPTKIKAIISEDKIEMINNNKILKENIENKDSTEEDKKIVKEDYKEIKVIKLIKTIKNKKKKKAIMMDGKMLEKKINDLLFYFI